MEEKSFPYLAKAMGQKPAFSLNLTPKLTHHVVVRTIKWALGGMVPSQN